MIIIVINDERLSEAAYELAEKLDGVNAVLLEDLEEYISKNYNEYNYSDSWVD